MNNISKDQKNLTLANLRDFVNHWLRSCEQNNTDPAGVEVIIQHNGRQYRPFNGFLSWSSTGVVAGFEYYDSDIIRYDPKDERPKEGEYWQSRGASSYDVSGFIRSKPAGERLLRMVKYLLETDEPKTWLDYREFEPNWIQFKFSASEFDVDKLDQLACANNNIITEKILRQCIRRSNRVED